MKLIIIKIKYNHLDVFLFNFLIDVNYFRIVPENEEIITELGLLYLEMGETSRAIQYFESALSHAPGFSKALLPLGFLKQVINKII